MDIIKRIEELRSERNWSEYQLREEAQLSSSLLSNMRRRGTLPSITTLENICAAFGITLAQFFTENENSLILSDEEAKLIETYRGLSKKNKSVVTTLINELK